MRVVVVRFMNIKMIEFIMKDEPLYKTIGASGGKEALKLLDEVSIDLILLDVMMPKEDGYEVCRKIRAKSDVPVILVTARGED